MAFPNVRQSTSVPPAFHLVTPPPVSTFLCSEQHGEVPETIIVDGEIPLSPMSTVPLHFMTPPPPRHAPSPGAVRYTTSEVETIAPPRAAAVSAAALLPVVPAAFAEPPRPPTVRLHDRGCRFDSPLAPRTPITEVLSGFSTWVNFFIQDIERHHRTCPDGSVRVVVLEAKPCATCVELGTHMSVEVWCAEKISEFRTRIQVFKGAVEASDLVGMLESAQFDGYLGRNLGDLKAYQKAFKRTEAIVKRIRKCSFKKIYHKLLPDSAHGPSLEWGCADVLHFCELQRRRIQFVACWRKGGIWKALAHFLHGNLPESMQLSTRPREVVPLVVFPPSMVP